MNDLDIIQQIETELSTNLEKLDQINVFSKGYTLNPNKQVTGLGLYDCNIKDLNRIIPFLKDLPQLQTLDLRSNQISDYSFLKDLLQLRSLNLSSNQISDISFLKDLPQLQTLDLSSNQISDISFLKDLPQLQTLNLSSNQISDISFLKDLSQLQTLSLSSNQISDISFLKDLPQLQTLYLGSNQISDYSFLQNLPQLQTLYLNSNQISGISFLKDLPQLQTLDLSSNQISDYSFLQNLPQLQTLYLGSNQISDYSFLKDLPQLQTLNLNSNQISDYSFLKDLPQLQTLNLSFNQISDYSFLKDLPQLQTLDLRFNQISDISFLKDLPQLQFLYLGSNQIHDISPLNELINLIKVNLYSNQISDIYPLEKLIHLKTVNLNRNAIENLPSWITKFNTGILFQDSWEEGNITLYANPLTNPPPEIVKQGKAAIRGYFKSLEGKRVPLNEVKVLLVGEGMAGKTSLLKQLQGLEFNTDESQTHGINVVTLQTEAIPGLPDIEGSQDFRLHFWDFGGQEIMHASHQFFLSKRSLYVLVLDSRTDSKKHHWLKHIEKFGGDSPLIVVMNKIDENPNYNIEQKRINDSFPNIKNRFHRISCKTEAGIPELLKCLAATIPETSLFGTEINENWMKVKDQLVAATEANNYISRDTFVQICEENHVAEESSQLTLLQYLHDLGVVLYFKQLNLANIYVLDPHWVTIGVYKIINSEKTKDGILKAEDLAYILNEETIKKDEYDPAREKKILYNPQEQSYIVSVMMQFELCYEYDKNNNHYIIPDLLPKELPNESELNEGTPLCFVMKYDYLPSSIISRLMLRFKHDIADRQQWKYGMVLDNQDFGCQAKVKADEQNKTIHITVQGEPLKKQRYFSAIRHSISTINQEFENLEIEELIPLPGYPGFLVEYQELLGHEYAGRDEYFVGKLGQSFSVSEMLDSIASQEERFMEKNMKENIHINLSNIGNSQLHATQHADLTATQQQTQTVTQIQNVQGLFKNLQEDILEEIDLEMEDDKEKKRLQNELQKVEKAFSELEQAASAGKKELESSTQSRLEEFIDNLADDNSRINKALQWVSKGTEKAQRLAKVYNEFAPFFALPSVPPALLK